MGLYAAITLYTNIYCEFTARKIEREAEEQTEVDEMLKKCYCEKIKTMSASKTG